MFMLWGLKVGSYAFRLRNVCFAVAVALSLLSIILNCVLPLPLPLPAEDASAPEASDQAPCRLS